MADEALNRLRTTGALPGLVAVAVGLQIAYPLVHGAARDHLTVLIVVALAGASVLHAAISRGVAVAAALFGVTALPGYAVEVLGVHTGFPFGSYAYSDSLGPRLLGVPPVVALAWTMLAWPAALAARRLVRGRVARVVVGAWTLASADLFLDPQQVAAGHWTWEFPAPHLPGVPDVPLTNYAGWLGVSLVLSVAVQAIAGDGDDRVIIGLYLWLYAAWIVALGGFLDLAAAAGWGALGMGAVALPLALQWRRQR
jgi:putative membrane protein